MTTQEKTHTIELTEQEFARVLFVMSAVNGAIYGKSAMSYAYDKLKVKDIGLDKFDSTLGELTEEIEMPRWIDYNTIQNEWESFLGLANEESVKNKDILDKIANMERELAELKGLL